MLYIIYAHYKFNTDYVLFIALCSNRSYINPFEKENLLHWLGLSYYSSWTYLTKPPNRPPTIHFEQTAIVVLIE